MSGFENVNLDINLIRNQTNLKLIDAVRKVEETKLNKRLYLTILYNENYTVVVPFISNMANIRGIELDTLVTAILNKATIFSQLISMVGTKQLFSDRIEASLTNDSLNSIITELRNV